MTEFDYLWPVICDLLTQIGLPEEAERTRKIKTGGGRISVYTLTGKNRPVEIDILALARWIHVYAGMPMPRDYTTAD